MLFNAQDEFAKLVEEVRIGQVGRPVADPRGGTKFLPHRPDIVVSDLPVFFMEGNQGVDIQAINAAEDAIEARQFHLPYPRSAFMMSLSGDYGGLRHLHPRFHVRHSYVMVFEEDDEQLHIVSFMKAETMERWTRQLFDFYLPFGVQLDEVTVSYDPAWGTFPPDFIFGVEMSLWTRLQIVLSFIHKMMKPRTDRGTATPIIGSPTTAKINARRSKMNLPPVQQVISIDLNQTVTTPIAKGTGTGSRKKPHFRHGAWHTRKATGKRSWHPPVAVHGGAGATPPWYEVKTPPL